ncbi:MAG: site-specific integrase [bacterium]
MKTKIANGKHKRAPKGSGRIYKRGADGKEYPADSPVNAPYWIAYTVPNATGGPGQRIRKPLRDADGNAITDRKTAEAERRRELAPYQTGNKADTLKAIVGRLAAAQGDHAQAVEDANPPLRIQDAWDSFIQKYDLRDKGGNRTLEGYDCHWKRFVTWLATAHPGVQYLRDVTESIGVEYASDLSASGLSANSFNKHVVLLCKMFAVHAKAARLTSNPFEKENIERRTLRTHSKRELTIEELTTILGTATGDLGLLLLLGAATGLRLGDCCTLTWGEVDLVRGVIRRIPNKTVRKGKPVVLGIPPMLHDKLLARAPKARTGYVLPAMAEKYLHDVPSVTNPIKAHILNCGIDVHAPGTGSRIKRDADGKPERHPETGRVVVEDTGKPALVDVGFHSLRHTWVSLHAARGTPQAIIQASVGHSNPAMTAHYTHVDEDTARDVALALPAFSGDAKPAREALPAWARKLVESLTPKNLRTVKAELLKG